MSRSSASSSRNVTARRSLSAQARFSSLAQVDAIVAAFLAGSMPADVLAWGVENPAIQSFVLCPDYASADFEAKVAATISGINDGTITLPPGV